MNSNCCLLWSRLPELNDKISENENKLTVNNDCRVLSRCYLGVFNREVNNAMLHLIRILGAKRAVNQYLTALKHKGFYSISKSVSSCFEATSYFIL